MFHKERRVISRENQNGRFVKRSKTDRVDDLSRNRISLAFEENNFPYFRWFEKFGNILYKNIDWTKIYILHIYFCPTIFYIIYSLALLGDDPLTQYVNVCAIDSIVCK